MNLSSSEISDLIKKRIQNFDFTPELQNTGSVISVKDGIVQVYGLENIMYGEVVQFPKKNIFGIALNLQSDFIGIIMLDNKIFPLEGDIVYGSGNVLTVPVGECFLGRVVNALGKTIDGGDIIQEKIFSPIEKNAPEVIFRKSINQPLQTGYASIDTLTPIGKGQRELIIGDRQTGKTTIGIDTIINQKNKNVKCIYVAIGQKLSSIANIVQVLKDYDAMKYTIVVSASASESAAMQFIAPFSGCTMGEYFRDKGEDALIVYDDLTKQAWAYRQISLLLRRPPGREAYPGDIFYLHSRLLERAACVNSEYIKERSCGKIQKKSGSLTALPIIETQAGDISGFISTNVISITDGQIYLETNLFNSGFRPAINSSSSVSRVGGSAQTKIIKKLGSAIKLSLAQFRELEAFSQFSSNLDSMVKKQITYGKKMMELMKQKQHNLLSISEMAILFFAIENGYLNSIEVNDIQHFKTSLINFFKNQYSTIFHKIEISGNYCDSIAQDLKKIILEFQKIYIP